MVTSDLSNKVRILLCCGKGNTLEASLEALVRYCTIITDVIDWYDYGPTKVLPRL